MDRPAGVGSRPAARLVVGRIRGLHGLKGTVRVEVLRRLVAEGIDAGLAIAPILPGLTDAEVRAILIRRDLLLQEIDLMIKEQGEAAVLYD